MYVGGTDPEVGTIPLGLTGSFQLQIQLGGYMWSKREVEPLALFKLRVSDISSRSTLHALRDLPHSRLDAPSRHRRGQRLAVEIVGNHLEFVRQWARHQEANLLRAIGIRKTPTHDVARNKLIAPQGHAPQPRSLQLVRKQLNTVRPPVAFGYHVHAIVRGDDLVTVDLLEVPAITRHLPGNEPPEVATTSLPLLHGRLQRRAPGGSL